MIKPGDEPIPGYRVEALLGRGQFGQVWRARSPGGAEVALKFLELSGVHGWKEFRAIQRVKQIRHAHLMPIIAIWLLDEQGQVLGDDAIESIASSHQETLAGAAPGDTLVAHPVAQSQRPAQLIVASLLADQSLGDRLKLSQDEGRKGIPVDDLLIFMGEAAKGLDFLNTTQHKIGQSTGAVQHCDVKPDNIMLSGGSVVIADFGVAQTLAQARLDATATSLGGTPAYMAPELFVNKPSRSSDQYSLAVTYYELRTGRLPFVEHTYAAVYQAHREGKLDFSACKPAEQEVLRRATATNPEQRFKSCTEFIDALAASARPKAMPAGSRPRSGLPALAATALVSVIGATAIGYGAYRWFDRPPPVPMGRVVITVDPADAIVTIDGEPIVAESAGRFVVERPIGTEFTVKASKSPERMERELEAEAQEDEQSRELELPYSAVYFAMEADRLSADGSLRPEAVAALAEAIKLEPDAYARLPRSIDSSAGRHAVGLLRLAGDGRRLAIATRDGTVRRWSIEASDVAKTGQVVHRHGGEVLALATTDAWTASASDADRHILLTDAAGRTLQLTIPDDAGRIKSAAIAGDGHALVAVSEVFELPPPERRVSMTLHAWNLDAPSIEGSRQTLCHVKNEFDPMLAAAHRQRWVALASTDGESWFVRQCPLDAAEASAPIYEQSGDVDVLIVSPDDRLIALGGGPVSPEADVDDYKTTLIDAASRRCQTLRRSHRDAISALAFDATGDYFAAGDVDGSAQGWAVPPEWDGSTQPGGEPVFLRDGADAVASIVCPRAGWVACCVGGRVAVWDCQPGKPTSIQLPGRDDVTAIAVTPDGRWLVTGHDDGAIRFWNLPRLMLVQRACAAAGEEVRSEGESDNQARTRFWDWDSTAENAESMATKSSQFQHSFASALRSLRPLR